MTLVTIYNSTITTTNLTNITNRARLATHDLSSQLVNNSLVFTLSPPAVLDSVQVVVDGLTLKPSTDTIVGDFKLNNATQLELLFNNPLSTSSTILAIYEEA
jgi:hypothetical protein